MIRKAKKSEITQVKKLIDSYEKSKEVFSEDYFLRILKKGILLVSIEENNLIGACFGTYNKRENWADLLGIVVDKKSKNKGIGVQLVKEFERIIRIKKIKAIDLYADEKQRLFFKKLNYTSERKYIAFRKTIK
jgi:N-acetylglutamate synthase-like GNAT family acetyltransferase